MCVLRGYFIDNLKWQILSSELFTSLNLSNGHNRGKAHVHHHRKQEKCSVAPESKKKIKKKKDAPITKFENFIGWYSDWEIRKHSIFTFLATSYSQLLSCNGANEGDFFTITTFNLQSFRNTTFDNH